MVRYLWSGGKRWVGEISLRNFVSKLKRTSPLYRSNCKEQKTRFLWEGVFLLIALTCTLNMRPVKQQQKTDVVIFYVLVIFRLIEIEIRITETLLYWEITAFFHLFTFKISFFEIKMYSTYLVSDPCAQTHSPKKDISRFRDVEHV